MIGIPRDGLLGVGVTPGQARHRNQFGGNAIQRRQRNCVSIASGIETKHLGCGGTRALDYADSRSSYVDSRQRLRKDRGGAPNFRRKAVVKLL